MQCAGTEFFLKRHLSKPSLCFTCVPGHPKTEFKTKQMCLFLNFSFTKGFSSEPLNACKKKNFETTISCSDIYIGRRCDFLNIKHWSCFAHRSLIFLSVRYVENIYELHNMFIKKKT